MTEREKLAGYLREYIAGADGDHAVKVPTEYLRRAVRLLSEGAGEREAPSNADMALYLVRYLDGYWRTPDADPCTECGAVLWSSMDDEGCDLCTRGLWPFDLASPAPLRCSNCGCKVVRPVTGNSLYDGEACCSDECEREHDDKGCPLEHGHYRPCPHSPAPTPEREAGPFGVEWFSTLRRAAEREAGPDAELRFHELRAAFMAGRSSMNRSIYLHDTPDELFARWLATRQPEASPEEEHG